MELVGGRILYVGSLQGTCRHQMMALKRLGWDVIPFDVNPFIRPKNNLARKIMIRTLVGPWVKRLNVELLRVFERERPALIWFDKAVFVWSKTVRLLRSHGAICVHFNTDNMYGPGKDPGWRLLGKAIKDYDVHLVSRKSNLEDYSRAGVKDVRLLALCYEPYIHFPPPMDWRDNDRTVDVSFVGSIYDARGPFLGALWREHAITTQIRGEERTWSRVLEKDEKQALYKGEDLHNDDYREALWRARINLSFITSPSQDDISRKSVEIAACGGFLLAERSPGHLELFKEGKEAVFFSSVEECAGLIRKYLPDEAARSRIAKAACLRAQSCGYANDDRIGKILEEIIRDYL